MERMAHVILLHVANGLIDEVRETVEIRGSCWMVANVSGNGTEDSATGSLQPYTAPILSHSHHPSSNTRLAAILQAPQLPEAISFPLTNSADFVCCLVRGPEHGVEETGGVDDFDQAEAIMIKTTTCMSPYQIN